MGRTRRELSHRYRRRALVRTSNFDLLSAIFTFSRRVAVGCSGWLGMLLFTEPGIILFSGAFNHRLSRVGKSDGSVTFAVLRAAQMIAMLWV
jgi:hypothetical protein